ncbi:ATP-binding cassette domain-containing protein [Streptomyces avidinii]
MASALLADPCTLLLDEPGAGLSRERGWLHGLLRGHACLGGAVLFTTDDAKEAARSADRVVSIEAGRSSPTRTRPSSPGPGCGHGSPCAPARGRTGRRAGPGGPGRPALGGDRRGER